MSLTAGQTVHSYYKHWSVVHSVISGEASSGEVFVDLLSTDPLPTTDVGVYATVVSSAGVPRTLTKVLYAPTTGLLDITGSSFATGDLVTVLAFKYYA